MVDMAPNNAGAEIYDGLKEYSYDPELGFVNLPGIFIRLKMKGFDEKLLYQYSEKSQQKSVIITYTKALLESEFSSQ